jgi:GTPase SAR1 family protein
LGQENAKKEIDTKYGRLYTTNVPFSITCGILPEIKNPNFELISTNQTILRTHQRSKTGKMNLASDLVLYISFFVDDLDTILNLSHLSKEVNEKCTSNLLWKSLLYRYYPEGKFFITKNYKRAFLNRQQHKMTMKKTDFVIAILGSPAVGKTSLSLQFTKTGTELFSATDYEPALSAFVHTSQVCIDEKSNSVSILDCCTQQYGDPNVISQLQMYPPDCYVLVFSLENKSSYVHMKNLDKYLKAIHGCSWYPRVIVGNKRDFEERKVHQEEIDEFLRENEVMYLETDAKHGVNTNESLMSIITQIQKHGSLQDRIPQVWTQIENDNTVTKKNPEGNGWLSTKFIQFIIAKVILTILCIEFKFLNDCIQKFNKNF